MRMPTYKELVASQVRQVVPFSDWKIYMAAKLHGRPYRSAMLSYGRRFIKKAACLLPVRMVAFGVGLGAS
jgi:hypothetical protein